MISFDFILLYCIVLYCIVLYCIVLYCIVMYFILFYFIVFYCILLYFILFYFILFYFILFYFILFYFILFYFILFYFILFFHSFFSFLSISLSLLKKKQEHNNPLDQKRHKRKNLIMKKNIFVGYFWELIKKKFSSKHNNEINNDRYFLFFLK